MSTFVYQARNTTSHVISGRLEAADARTALALLFERELHPIALRALSVRSVRWQWLSRRVARRDVAATLRALAHLITGGVPLLSALQLLTEQATSPALRDALVAVADAVRAGQPLAQAFQQHPAIFRPLDVHLVAAGELGGALPTVLLRLADTADAEEELRLKVLAACAYPALVLVVGCATVIALLVSVMPTLIGLFEDTGQALPWPTQILLTVSRVMVHWGWLMALALLGGAWVLRRCWRTTAGRLRLEQLIQRVPVLGALLRHVDVARMSRSLAMLLGQGAPLLQALDVVALGSGQRSLQRALASTRTAVAGGQSLAQAMSATAALSPDAVGLLRVGEDSGTLTQALTHIADGQERLVAHTTRLMTTVLEPLLVLAVGAVIGAIVLAMLLPILDISALAG